MVSAGDATALAQPCPEGFTHPTAAQPMPVLDIAEV